MAEAIFKDSFPDLKELENKVGRKIPESLLIWMKDAANCEDGWRSDVVDRGDHGSALSDSISAKISYLKQEMRWLRSADVRILCQLVAVHEGIEAMRWLMEERGALASRGSSLTSSLSSLVTVEEPGPWMSPCRESPSPTCLQDLTETTGEESDDQQPSHSDDGDSCHKSCFNMLSPKSTKARPPSIFNCNFEVTCSTHGLYGQASTNPPNSARLQKSQSLDLDGIPLPDIKSRANTIRRALLRSSRVRREVSADSFKFTKQSGETQTEHQTQESFRASQNNTSEADESTPNAREVLLDYDAQWCWVESQDDVTFL